MYSEALGLELRLERGAFRFRDPATARDLLDYLEALDARREAEDAQRGLRARLDEEATTRREAEARVAELEARLRGDRE